MSRGTYHILIVEDVPEEVELTTDALDELSFDIDIQSCQDGQEAINYLLHKTPYENSIRPDLIFLDLNMPGMDGKEFLSLLRANENLCMIPVIILTTSSSEADIKDCYEAGCNAYITKPLGLAEYRDTFKTVAEYWFATVTLP